MSGGRFARSTAMTTVARGLTVVLALGSSVLLARALGPEGYGVYVYATTFAHLASLIATFGTSTATVYYVARAPEEAGSILAATVGCAIAFGTAVALACVAAIHVAPALFTGAPRGVLLVVLAAVPAMFAMQNLQMVCLGLGRFHAYNAAWLGQAGLNLGLLVLGLGAAPDLAAIAFTSSYAATALALLASILPRLGLRDGRPYLRRLVGFGLLSHPANVIQGLQLRLDVFLLGALRGEAAVGLYGPAASIAEKLWLLPDAAATVLFPRVAAHKEGTKRQELTPLVARTVMAVSVLGACALALAAPWAIPLAFSRAYEPTVGPLLALLPGVVALSASKVLASDVTGRGLPLRMAVVAAAGLVTNVAANLVLIPRLGIVGAALASSLSYGVTLAVVLVIYCRLSGHRAGDVLFLKGTDLGRVRAAAAGVRPGA